jgi:hypothetical protein
VVIAVLLVVVGSADPTTTNSTATPRSYGKPEAAAVVDKLLMMGKRMPETVELYLNDKQ